MQYNIKIFLNKLSTTKLIKHSAYYSFFNIVEKSIPFLILPIITRIFTQEEVGFYILYQAVVSILIPLMTLTTDSSVILSYYKEDKQNFPRYLSNSIFVFLLNFSFYLALLYALSNHIYNLISFPSSWMFVIAGIVFVRYFTQLRQNIWRLKYELKKYGTFTIGISILKNAIGLLLIFKFSFSWEGLIIGHLIGYTVFALISVYTFYIESFFDFRISTNYIKDSISVGYPLSLHTIGSWLGNAANKFIVTAVIGSAATGNYGIGAAFAAVVTIFEGAINKAFMPHLFDKLNNIQKYEKYDIVLTSYYFYLSLIVVSAIVYTVGYYGTGFIFGDNYINTREFMLPLIIAAMLNGFYKLHVNYIMFTKKTLNITTITISTGLMNIILAYFLTINYGIIGTAYSLLIIKLIQYLLTFYVSNKLMPMPWFNVKHK